MILIVNTNTKETHIIRHKLVYGKSIIDRILAITHGWGASNTHIIEIDSPATRQEVSVVSLTIPTAISISREKVIEEVEAKTKCCTKYFCND